MGRVWHGQLDHGSTRRQGMGSAGRRIDSWAGDSWAGPGAMGGVCGSRPPPVFFLGSPPPIFFTTCGFPLLW